MSGEWASICPMSILFSSKWVGSWVGGLSCMIALSSRDASILAFAECPIASCSPCFFANAVAFCSAASFLTSVMISAAFPACSSRSASFPFLGISFAPFPCSSTTTKSDHCGLLMVRHALSLGRGSDHSVVFHMGSATKVLSVQCFPFSPFTAPLSAFARFLASLASSAALYVILVVSCRN